tara:strand:- start:2702 stop:2995 length:294 start_codon:yes stop_codon:yes gene_type:complete
MAISRYRNDLEIRGGTLKASARAVMRIRKAIRAGSVRFRVIRLKEDARLDQIAGEAYGNGSLWWVIAAASDIGWAWQCPAGTEIRLPTDLSEIMGLI